MHSFRPLSFALAAGFLAPVAAAQKPSTNQDLREEIRQIVREEIRAALQDVHGAHATATEPAKTTKVADKKANQVAIEVEGLDGLLGQIEKAVGEKTKAATKAQGHGNQAMKFVTKDGGEGVMVLQLDGDGDEKPHTIALRCEDGACKVVSGDQVGTFDVQGGTFTIEVNDDEEGHPAKIEKALRAQVLGSGKAKKAAGSPMVIQLGEGKGGKIEKLDHVVVRAGNGGCCGEGSCCTEGACSDEPKAAAKKGVTKVGKAKEMPMKVEFMTVEGEESKMMPIELPMQIELKNIEITGEGEETKPVKAKKAKTKGKIDVGPSV